MTQLNPLAFLFSLILMSVGTVRSQDSLESQKARGLAF